MNQFFLFWYYSSGLRDAVVVAFDLVRFTWRKWNITGLFLTLASPWKRDVAYKNWRGFRPVKWLNAILNNLISRFIGMIVRLVVIATGLVCFGLAIAAAVVALGSFILAPALVLLGTFLLLVLPVYGVVLILLGIGGFSAAAFAYGHRASQIPDTPDVALIRKAPWFPRVLARLGFTDGLPEPGALENMEQFRAFLSSSGIEERTYERAVACERYFSERRRKRESFWLWENLRRQPIIGRGWQYAYTPHLDRYSVDLSHGDPTEYSHLELVGRTEELQVAGIVLERPTQNSLVLLGEPGVGKQTFIHHLARLIRENFFEGTFFADARMMVFDLGMAVSDSLNQGQDPESAVRLLLSEAAYAGNIILVIRNIDRFLGNDPSHHNFAHIMAEYLASPTLRVIGTASSENYHSLMKQQEQALKFFEPIYLSEPSEDETLIVLLDQFAPLERKRIIFTMKAIEGIISASGKYNWEAPFPERALDLAEETLQFWQGTGEPLITPETVNAYITVKTGVPVGELADGEKDKLLHLEELLHERIIGQDEAVKQVAEAMRKARAGFSDDKRPLGSFLFLGPTGVGKTETVKAFAASYFGSEDRMIRLDMSEFQTPEAIDRLIGSRDRGVQGELTNIAKEKPFSILLLDEVEKAYPKALDLFLQILDEGFVTDGYGHKASFRNMIIVATSNAGAPLIKKLVEQGAPQEDIRRQVLDSVVESGLFRLEFLNRFDGLIFFAPLTPDELTQVVTLKLASFAARLKKEKNITVTFAPDVATKVVELGYEPEFGARSLNRYIDDSIADKIARKIISGALENGSVLPFSAEDLSL